MAGTNYFQTTVTAQDQQPAFSSPQTWSLNPFQVIMIWDQTTTRRIDYWINKTTIMEIYSSDSLATLAGKFEGGAVVSTTLLTDASGNLLANGGSQAVLLIAKNIKIFTDNNANLANTTNISYNNGSGQLAKWILNETYANVKLALVTYSPGTGDVKADGTVPFTGQESFGAGIFMNAGTVLLPSIVFTGDADSGIYRIGANNIGVSANAAKVLDISTTGLGVTGTILNGDGTVSLPSYSFTSDTDCGMYHIGANNIGIGVAGAKVLDISAIGLGVVGSLLNSNGTVSLPAISFTSDPDSGVYRIAANNIGIGVNGAKVLDIGVGGLAIVGVTTTGDGTVGAPSFSFTSDPDCGLYHIGANDIGFAVGGAKVQEWIAAGSIVTGTFQSTGVASLAGIVMADATNIVVNTTTGTKIGTGVTQKIGFWNVTPVVQQVLATGASHTADDIITFLQIVGLCKQS